MRIELLGARPLLMGRLPLRTVDDGWLVLDASGLTFASPLELAAIVASATGADYQRIPVAFVLPREDSVRSYLTRMDVPRRLPRRCEIEGQLAGGERNDLSASLLEVTPVDADSADDVATRLGRLLATQFGPRTARRAVEGLGELIDNATDHGRSAPGAFVAAQTYTGATSGRAGLEAAICDTGIGILHHLRQNPRHQRVKTARGALLRALRPGVTGTSDPRGNGLRDWARAAAAGGSANLHLRSGDAVATVEVTDGQTISRVESVGTAIQGTWALVRIDLPTS